MELIRRVLRPSSWIMVGAGLFSVGTLVVFSMLGWSLLIATIVILIIALLVVIVILIRQIRAAKASDEIETTIVRQADRDIERSRPGQAAEMETLKTDLVRALQALKQSKLGRHGGLARVPIYMLIGPAQSGKSTLVERSGLHFPLADRAGGARAVQGVGGTRGLQWWLSEEAILLDLPGGRLTAAEFEDDDDWVAFLATLRKQRKDKPLSGVIVTVGLDQLAERNEVETDKLARRVRDRVRELIKHLGVVFPTYVVFTRADRVAGFAEFFAGLDDAARRQPWGAAIPPERARDRGPGDLFDAEFDLLSAALSERVLGRVADLPDPAQRARAFAFRLQLETLREAMGRFLAGLFESSPMEETPLFRGFYLTSLQSGGAALDRVIQPAAQSFGVPAAEQGAASPPSEGPLFVDELLKRVVFPDADLATITSAEEARRRRRQLVMFAGLGVLFLGFSMSLTAISCMNGRIVDRTRRAAADVSQQVSPDRALMTNLGYLEELRAKAALVDSLHQGGAPWYRRVAYAGHVVREPAIDLYVMKTYGAIVAPAVRNMAANMTTWLDSGQEDFLRLYRTYRAWRLLTGIEHFEAEDDLLVALAMADALSPELAGATGAEQAAFPELMERQARFLQRHRSIMSRRANVGFAAGDQELKVRAASRLRELWTTRPFYDEMIAVVTRSTPPVGFADLVGQTTIMSGSHAVPGPFTLDGWKNQMSPRLATVARRVPEDWVIGTIFGGDRPPLADSLELLYAQDYSREWVSFLQGVDAAQASRAEASPRLKKLVQDDGPLFRLMEGVAKHTNLEIDRTTHMGKAVVSGFALAHMEAAPGGEKPGTVKKLIGWLPGQGGPAGGVDPSRSPRENYVKLLRDLQERVAEATQPNAPQAAWDGLSVPKDPNDNPPIPKLNAYCNGLSCSAGGDGAPAMARILKLPGKVVTGLDPGPGPRPPCGQVPPWVEEWNQRVAEPFQQTLAGKYPLSPGGTDATLSDFAEFFRPGGTFWQFHDARLKQLVNENGTLVSPGAAASISPAMLDAVRKAYEIREAFFAAGPTPSLAFSVRTTQPDLEHAGVLVHWTSLDLHGQSLQYNMGAPIWQAMTWPGPIAANGAVIRANVGGAEVKSPLRPGVWGLFKLLDSGVESVSGAGSPLYTFKLVTAGNAITVPYEFQTSSTALKKGFLRFTLPASISAGGP